MQLIFCNFQDTFSQMDSFIDEELNKQLQQHISATTVHKPLDFAKHLKEASLSYPKIP